MKVTLLNPEQTKNIFKEWGTFACECYDTPVKYAERVGNKCYEDEHYSGSRTEYIKFKIEDIDRGIAEQIMRHEIGTRQHPIDENTYDENPNNIIKNMKSFRYVDMNNFDYTIPTTILNNSYAKEQYMSLMGYINLIRDRIKKSLIESGIKEKQAVEDANYVLPRGTNISLCVGFTPEALIHYMHKRLCTNAQDLHRNVAKLMKDEVTKVLPILADRLVPHCEYLLWCPETHRCCGRKPTKIELINKIKEVKE
jgi:thymidylate synthase (FAD)